MKIEKIETIFVDRFMFVRIYTDSGLVGLGESGAFMHLGASAQAVETFKRYLIGKDPLRIEHHSQFMYRSSHFRGSAVMGAISAIDIALWDIAGKHFNVPCYQLLGGNVRDKARVYYHVIYKTHDDLVEGCKQAKRMGFTAIGALSPFIPESFNMTHTKMMTTMLHHIPGIILNSIFHLIFMWVKMITRILFRNGTLFSLNGAMQRIMENTLHSGILILMSFMQISTGIFTSRTARG